MMEVMLCREVKVQQQLECESNEEFKRKITEGDTIKEAEGYIGK
jgi:hypothetical protein